MNLTVDKLNFRGEQYPNMKIKYDSVNHELFLDNKTVTGSIFLNPDEDKIDIKLDKLIYQSTKIKLRKIHWSQKLSAVMPLQLPWCNLAVIACVLVTGF